MLISCNTQPTEDLPSSQNPLEIPVTGGSIVGFSESGVDKWLGIPFAAPPLGELRWKEPQPVIPWEGIRQANKFGATPMQHNVWGDMNYRSEGFSEDCLYLNVWAPVGERKALPVLLYFYGGGLIAGDGSETRYDGASMAREGIIVVTTNYRLNVFGALAHPELSAESPGKTSGNYDFYDQVAALTWVRNNIAAFGGDPNRITIGGESAGSISTSLHLVSPLSRDKIAGAICESGAGLEPTWPLKSLKEAEEIGLAFAKTIGAPTLAELRALPADTLYARYRKANPNSFPLVKDGRWMAKTTAEYYAAGELAKVPLLVGWNSQEMGDGKARLGDDASSPEKFKNRISKDFPENPEEIIAVYPTATQKEFDLSLANYAGDNFIVIGGWKQAHLHALQSAKPVFRYLYNQSPPGYTLGGAPHAAEIPYALGNHDVHNTLPWTDADRATSKTMKGYFANFIKTGNPNGDNLPDWPSLVPGAINQPTMVIAAESKLEEVNDTRLQTLAKRYE